MFNYFNKTMNFLFSIDIFIITKHAEREEISTFFKNGGILINLLAYEESAISQQWISQKYPISDG